MAGYHFRSIFISDFHLGIKNLQSQKLLDFLLCTESEYLYLVGDIFDLLQAQKKWHWPVINDEIVHTVFEKACNGTKVYYIPGNHDHMLGRFDGYTFNGIVIARQVVHETAEGRRYLVTHGDKFDPVVQKIPWLASIGSSAYELLLKINPWTNFTKRDTGRKKKSLSAWLKHQVKTAVNFFGKFEEMVTRETSEYEVDGLICGHIHHASIREIGKALYANSGDWVESCTALAENHAGHLGIVEWLNEQPLAEQVTAGEYENLYRDRCLASSN
jgi:UDP-2,3-diacylglucosamine pyrophosphatase LpxH